MPVDAQESRPGIIEVIGAGVNPISRRIRRPVIEATRRIKDQIPEHLPSYIQRFLGNGSDNFVTDRPCEVFGGNNETLLTISTSLVFRNRGRLDNQDKILLPTSHHLLNDTQTHRGIGLEIFSALMNGFGYDLGAKDDFVWLGTQVDAEQFAVHDAIARKGKIVDRKVASQIFVPDDPSKYFKDLRHNTNFQLRPELEELITAISEGDDLSKYRKYVDGLLQTLHTYDGLRDGWYETLEGLLTGSILPKVPKDPEHIESLLIHAALRARRVSQESQAIVIEVDKQKLFGQTPILAFPLTPRPPDTIVPARFINYGAVRAIYAEDPSRLEDELRGLPFYEVSKGNSPNSRHARTITHYLVNHQREDQFELRPLEDLPRDRWLPDTTGKPVTPAQAREYGSDPRNPICVFRYSPDPDTVWNNQLRNGHIAPLNGVDNPKLLDSSYFAERALRTMVLEEASRSGLLRHITSLSGDPSEAEKQLLLAASGKLSIPAVIKREKDEPDNRGKLYFTPYELGSLSTW